VARAGRKRKIGVKREKNGRVQRPEARRQSAEQEAMSVARGYRERVHGVPSAEALNQMAGSFVGRLCMDKEISLAQYDAAMIFLQDHRNNAIAIAAPRDPAGMDFNRVHGGTLDGEDVDFYRRATTRWREACKAIQDRQNELRGQGALYAALEVCVLRDVEAHHMVGWLREGLDALSRHYGIVDNAHAA